MCRWAWACSFFSHRTSLGGINIRASYVQLSIDAVILLSSLVGTSVLNLILATNHRPGRYMGVS